MSESKNDKPESIKEDEPKKKAKPKPPAQVSVVVQVAHESWKRGDKFSIVRDADVEKKIAAGLLAVDRG
jgi:hypothetical protein